MVPIGGATVPRTASTPCHTSILPVIISLIHHTQWVTHAVAAVRPRMKTVIAAAQVGLVVVRINEYPLLKLVNYSRIRQGSQLPIGFYPQVSVQVGGLLTTVQDSLVDCHVLPHSYGEHTHEI